MNTQHYFISSIIASAALFAIAAILSYLAFSGSDYLLVIHFDSYKGINWFGNKWDVFGILGTGLFLGLVNFILVGALYSYSRFLSLLFSFFTVFLMILILISVGVIIAIN